MQYFCIFCFIILSTYSLVAKANQGHCPNSYIKYTEDSKEYEDTFEELMREWIISYSKASVNSAIIYNCNYIPPYFEFKVKNKKYKKNDLFFKEIISEEKVNDPLYL